MGGVYLWAAIPVIAGAAVLGAIVRPRIATSDETRLLDYSLLAILAGIGIQLIPLPPALVRWLSPHAQEVRSAISLQFRPDDAFTALSIDPGATVYGLLLTSACIVFFWACRDIFHQGGVRRGVRSVAWLGLLASLVALIQTATSPTRVYWFWDPIDVGAFPFGPFINRNHFAAWVIMAIPLVTGYLVARRVRRWGRHPQQSWFAALFDLGDVRTTWLVASALLMVLGLMLSLSRSGLIALVVVSSTSLWLLRERLGRQGRAWAGATAVLVLLLVLSWTDVGALIQEVDAGIDEPSGGRLPIWRDTAAVIRDFWITGAGAGTYQRAMLVYQQSSRAVFFNQAHNHYLQVAAEGGLLLVVPSVLAIVGFVRLAAQRIGADQSWRDWLRVGAAVGLGSVAVQSLWESGLRMPANALLCAILAGLLVHAPRTHGRREAGGDRTSEPQKDE